MSSILRSEHCKSVCEFRVTNEIHKSNNIKADRYDRILQPPQNEWRRSWLKADLYELPGPRERI